MTNKTTDYMSLYLEFLSELKGKTIKDIDTTWGSEEIYIITEDGYWTIIDFDPSDSSMELLQTGNAIEYILQQGRDCLFKRLNNCTNFDYELYQQEQKQRADNTDKITKEKKEKEELRLLEELASKHGKKLI